MPWAWTLRREWAPMVTPLLAAILVGGLYVGWKRTRWPGRTALSLIAILGVGVAWFAYQNHFEWMFNPIAAPRFDVGAKAPAVDPDDLVLGVVIKDDAVAFPVRRIGYHHVVNVTIGGEPIVASYCTLCHGHDLQADDERPRAHLPPDRDQQPERAARGSRITHVVAAGDR